MGWPGRINRPLCANQVFGALTTQKGGVRRKVPAVHALFWEIMGSRLSRQYNPHMVGISAYLSTCRNDGFRFGHSPAPSTHFDSGGGRLFPNFPVDSHVIPCHPFSYRRRREQRLGGDKTPNGKSQVSYRHPPSPNQEIRRSDEQTSPQVVAAAGQDPEMGTRAADRAVAAARSAVVFPGCPIPARGTVKGARRWHAGSEGRRRSRWTRRVAFPSPPPSAV